MINSLSFPPLPLWFNLGYMRSITNKWQRFSDTRKLTYINNIVTQIEARRNSMNDWVTLDTFNVDY
jgi:hypothetical protein